MRNSNSARWTILALLGLSFVVAEPCGMAWRAGDRGLGQPVRLTKEQVVIVWDPATQTEHFIRQAEFDTREKDFGFLVPVPSVPQIVEVKSRAFGVLTDYVENNLSRPRGGASGGGGFSGGGGGSKGVTVFSVAKVGDYIATVLTGSDGAAVSEWLTEHGYATRPALTDFLDHYTKKHWGFAAFQFDGAPGGKTSTQAVRLSFKTDTPYYPYKAPEDNWPSNRHKPLTVFFISNTEVRAFYEKSQKEWEAQRIWKGVLGVYEVAEVQSSFLLTNKQIPTPPKITVFKNETNKTGYGEDLVFRPKK